MKLFECRGKRKLRWENNLNQWETDNSNWAEFTQVCEAQSSQTKRNTVDRRFACVRHKKNPVFLWPSMQSDVPYCARLGRGDRASEKYTEMKTWPFDLGAWTTFLNSSSGQTCIVSVAQRRHCGCFKHHWLQFQAAESVIILFSWSADGERQWV